MFVVIAVGHKYGLAVIPTALLADREVINTVLPGLSMRLNMMAKGRVDDFDYPFIGHKIKRLPEGADCESVVHTILSAIEHAEFLEHDHIKFTRTDNLILYAVSAHAAMCRRLELLKQRGIINGTLGEMSREEERLFMFTERAKIGVAKTEMIW